MLWNFYPMTPKNCCPIRVLISIFIFLLDLISSPPTPDRNIQLINCAVLRQESPTNVAKHCLVLSWYPVGLSEHVLHWWNQYRLYHCAWCMITDQMTKFNAKIGCCALIQVLRLRLTLDVVYVHANLMEKNYSLFFCTIIYIFHSIRVSH